MPRYIAFLRGINVGGHRVKMDRLRDLFEELGFGDVSTFIASGNVIFATESEDVDALRQTIESHLADSLGYEVAVFLRSPAQLAAMLESNPPEDDSGGSSAPSHYVIFLHAAASKSLRSAVAAFESETDAFRFSGTEIHWRIQGKLSESPLFGGILERAFKGTATTTRNMNTIRRIAPKAASPGDGKGMA
jgi:uncharacterized protein (DUF1697 family)